MAKLIYALQLCMKKATVIYAWQYHNTELSTLNHENYTLFCISGIYSERIKYRLHFIKPKGNRKMKLITFFSKCNNFHLIYGKSKLYSIYMISLYGMQVCRQIQCSIVLPILSLQLHNFYQILGTLVLLLGLLRVLDGCFSNRTWIYLRFIMYCLSYHVQNLKFDPGLYW